MADTRVEAWVRGRFVPLPQARLKHVSANAYTLRLPRDPETAKALRVRSMDLRALEDLVIALDGEEVMQVIGSAEGPDWVELAILV